jgi:polyhydroxybutyrate depolymerase
MKSIAAALVLIALPPTWALIDAVSFSVHNRSNGSIVSSGLEREYLLYVPRSYDPAKPAPLVISMHGAAGWPVLQMEMSGWNAVAEKEGFIVVYPAGVAGAGPRTWAVDRGPGLRRDVRYIADLIDKLEATYNIDRERIYANGLSNGGGMAFVLSCAMADRIAAVGMVGAAQTLPWSWCSSDRSVPMITFHGTKDPAALYDGGRSWVSPLSFPSVPVWTENWSRRNRCAREPVESRIAGHVTRREYVNCAGDASVVLYTIHGGGHTWPGSGTRLPEWFMGETSKEIDASAEMWRFFRAHKLGRYSTPRGL